jgi:glycosyltransferase involved in cell wall biosynthesis
MRRGAVLRVTRVLIITGANVGARMSGPAIRASAMARVLAADGHDVTLVTTGVLDDEHRPAAYRVASVAPRDRRSFARLHDAAELIVFQGHAMEQFPRLAKSDRVVVADAYDPMHLEMLEQARDEPRATWELVVRQRVALLNQQLARADLILCASERQRLFYLGELTALGRVSPATYAQDPDLGRLLAVAPFGIEEKPPARDRPALRGVLSGLDASSRVLVWGGGIYPWFDPLLLIKATHAVAQRRPNTRLVFLGTTTPGHEPMGIVKEAMDCARELGALGSSVIFNEGWIPYDERGAFFLDADAGVSTHHAHLETEFSFRTRILDYLWSGLPMVVTEGDTFADLVAQEELGVVVPAGDGTALAVALEKILFDDAFRAAAARRVAEVRGRFLWESTLEPLRQLAREPRHAADVVGRNGRKARQRQARALTRDPLRPGLVRDLRLTAHHLRHGGLGAVRDRLSARKSRP